MAKVIYLIMSIEGKYGLDVHLARFSTEKECYDYLFSVKWGNQSKCSSCGNTHMNYYLASRKTYKCSRCYKQFSLIQGTIFEKSRIPLTKWFIAMYLFTTNKRGISSVQLSKWLGVTQRTAWFMLHRLREALKDENNIVLNGFVEADETFVGPDVNRDRRLGLKRKKHYEKQSAIHGFEKNVLRRKRGYAAKRGRKKGSTKEVLELKKLEREKKGERIPFEMGTVVFGMMEQGGRTVMKVLGNSRRCITPKYVEPHLKNHITSKSILFTDEGVAYGTAKNHFYEHETVNHEIGYVINGIHINNIENAWKHLKKMIDGTYFHVSFRHFERYLNENTYRWNRRNESEKKLFEDFMPLITGKHIIFDELKQNKLAA